MQKPSVKPKCPNFSSGPCAKRPGWTVDALKNALVGRSHRSGPGKKALLEVIENHRRLLNIPDDYKVAIMPASDTGALEMAMWSMLGARGVDAIAWESFGADWQKDITGQLKIADTRVLSADYGQIVDLSTVNFDNDVVFTWNGTTSGVRVPSGDWIAKDRKGLTFCDATSAVFAYDMPWDRLDVTTWSWQKVLGGEAAHGMLVLSPRAVERLETYKPAWPLPKIFRMTKKNDAGKTVLNDAIFVGETINTPSMVAVEDCLDALRWVESVGGVKGTIQRTKDNLAAIEAWVEKSDWISFLPVSADIRSRTSVCLAIKDAWFTALPEERKMPFIKDLTKTLDSEGVAKDIASYKSAPAGLRIWSGATVEQSDIAALLPWLDWAYAVHKDAELKKAA